MVSGTSGVFGYYVYKLNKSDVPIEQSNNIKPTEKDQVGKDFIVGNVSLGLSNYEKMLVINFSGEKDQFNLQEFKIIFFRKFMGLLPVNDKVNIKYYANNYDFVTNIKVEYIGKYNIYK